MTSYIIAECVLPPPAADVVWAYEGPSLSFPETSPWEKNKTITSFLFSHAHLHGVQDGPPVLTIFFFFFGNIVNITQAVHPIASAHCSPFGIVSGQPRSIACSLAKAIFCRANLSTSVKVTREAGFKTTFFPLAVDQVHGACNTDVDKEYYYMDYLPEVKIRSIRKKGAVPGCSVGFSVLVSCFFSV